MPVPVPPSVTPAANSSHEQASGCLIRLCWMGVGNVALMIAAIAIWKSRESLFSVTDIVFWALAAMVLAVRYLDIKKCGGRTADGAAPATMAHWRRYAWLFIGVCLLLWILAHAAARVSL